MTSAALEDVYELKMGNEKADAACGTARRRAVQTEAAEACLIAVDPGFMTE
jgi:hypothetical protein